jgi:hypothetical protein
MDNVQAIARSAKGRVATLALGAVIVGGLLASISGAAMSGHHDLGAAQHRYHGKGYAESGTSKRWVSPPTKPRL